MRRVRRCAASWWRRGSPCPTGSSAQSGCRACCAHGWPADASIRGAYWPIKGEFDPLPALYRWSEGSIDGEPRRIGLPVADRAGASLRFHVWYPGCPTEPDAFDIPKPKGTDPFMPTLLVVPCLGFGPGGVRLGYGGGFFASALASLQPRPVMIGVSYAHGFLPMLRLAPGDLQLDALLTEDGVMWQRS
jgi:5,10-methenyltetrahydrofolate synthetase